MGWTHIPAVRSSADTTGGLGEGLPRGKFEKKSQMVASGGICGKDIDL